MRVDQIDKNFEIKTDLGVTNYTVYDIRKQDEFEILGLHNPKETEKFMRMSEDDAQKVSPSVNFLKNWTSGGRIRFATDSEYIIFKSQSDVQPTAHHMTRTMQKGFDMYEKIGARHVWRENFVAPDDNTGEFEVIYHFGSKKMRNLIINFPLYSTVNNVFIGLENDAKIQRCEPYTYEKPIVFYGSSITQGGCASRPGTCFHALVSRKFDTNYINFGFSGNGLGEAEMAQYIAKIDCSLLVMDFFNTRGVESLEANYKKFYEIFRKEKPDTPIILVTCSYPIDNYKIYRAIVAETYASAIRNGDNNIYMVDAERCFDIEERDCCMIDGCHPTDLGFYLLAQGLYTPIREIFSKMEQNK